jgi:hypothetical protein
MWGAAACEGECAASRVNAAAGLDMSVRPTWGDAGFGASLVTTHAAGDAERQVLG